jgi:hypothetical protein
MNPSDKETSELWEDRRAILQLHTSSVYQTAGFTIAFALVLAAEVQLIPQFKSYLPEFILYSAIIGTGVALALTFDSVTWYYQAIDTILHTALTPDDAKKGDAIIYLTQLYGDQTNKTLKKSPFTKITAFRAEHPWQTRTSITGFLAFVVSLPFAAAATGYVEVNALGILELIGIAIPAIIGLSLEYYVFKRPKRD